MTAFEEDYGHSALCGPVGGADVALLEPAGVHMPPLPLDRFRHPGQDQLYPRTRFVSGIEYRPLVAAGVCTLVSL